MYIPVTTFYASLLGLLLIVLSALVSKHRRKARVSIGVGDNIGLERASRVHGNFIEYVPIALILLLMLELEISKMWLLHLLGAMLLMGRLLHAWGLNQPTSVTVGRWWGTCLTWLMILVTSLLNLWHSV